MEVYLEMKISEIPKEIRPREKALRYGIETVSDDELLAIIIGSGVRGCSAIDIGRNLLTSHASLEMLSTCDFSSLEEQTGLSSTLVLRLLAAFELHKRLASPMYQNKVFLLSSKDIYDRYKYLENYTQEAVVLLMLNKKRKVIKEKLLYQGTTDSVLVNPKEVIAEVIKSNCSDFVIVHNHPDGSFLPSDEDIYVTETLKEIGSSFQIKMVDHIIISQGGYYSFIDEKYLKTAV